MAHACGKRPVTLYSWIRARGLRQQPALISKPLLCHQMCRQRYIYGPLVLTFPRESTATIVAVEEDHGARTTEICNVCGNSRCRFGSLKPGHPRRLLRPPPYER